MFINPLFYVNHSSKLPCACARVITRYSTFQFENNNLVLPELQLNSVSIVDGLHLVELKLCDEYSLSWWVSWFFYSFSEKPMWNSIHEHILCSSSGNFNLNYVIKSSDLNALDLNLVLFNSNCLLIDCALWGVWEWVLEKVQT